MKRFGSLALVLMLLLTGLSAAVQAEEQITLRAVWWGSQTRHDGTLEVIKLYQERNPHVKIESQFMAWDGYWEMMAAQIAGNNLADIFQQDYQYLQQYADKGLMYDLGEFVDSGVLNLDDVDQNTLDSGSVDGKLYAISLGLNSQCVVYNPERFEEAGMEFPKDDWTWEDYTNTIKELYEKTGIYGEEVFVAGNFHGLNHWLRQHGFSFYSQEGPGLGYTDDQLVADFWQMDIDLVRIGAMPTMDIRDEIKNPEMQLMVTDESAMMGGFGGSNQLAAMVNAAGKEFKLAPNPHLEGEVSGQFLKPSQFFSIYSGTKHAEEAAKFIDFMTNDVDANMIMQGERGVPISSKIREALLPTMDATQQEIFDYIDRVSKFAFPIGKPEPQEHAELSQILKNIHYEVISEQIDPLEGAKKLRAEAERVFGI